MQEGSFPFPTGRLIGFCSVTEVTLDGSPRDWVADSVRVVVEVDRDLFPIVLKTMGSYLFMSKLAVVTVDSCQGPCLPA